MQIWKRWPLAPWMFALHAVPSSLVYLVWLSSGADVERDMIWLWLYFFDLPIALLYEFVEPQYGLQLFFTSVRLGGLQWALVGLGLDALRRFVLRRQTPRGTPNI